MWFSIGLLQIIGLVSTSANVMLFKKSECQNVGDVCFTKGLYNVSVNDRNLAYLANTLRVNNIESAYVSGWQGRRIDMVLRPNGSLTPYNDLTNNTCYALCSNQCEVDPCFSGNPVCREEARHSSHSGAPGGGPIKVIVVAPPVKSLEPDHHVIHEPSSSRKKENLLPAKPTSPVCFPVVIPIVLKCSNYFGDSSESSTSDSSNDSDQSETSLQGSSYVTTECPTSYTCSDTSRLHTNRRARRHRQRPSSECDYSELYSSNSDSRNPRRHRNKKRLMCYPIRGGSATGGYDPSNSIIDEGTLYNSVLSCLKSNYRNTSEDAGFHSKDVRKALKRVLKNICNDPNVAKYIANAACGTKRDKYDLSDVKMAVGKGKRLLEHSSSQLLHGGPVVRNKKQR